MRLKRDLPRQVRAYVRVSTVEQAREGYSIQTQTDLIARFCQYEWEGIPVAWYTDDGCSAKSLEGRDALKRLRKEVEPGDAVVVVRLDRLTRSVRDLYTLLEEWDRRGVRFRSTTEEYDTKSALGRAMLTLMATFAQWERERNAERVAEVMRTIMEKAPRPLTKAPIGYDMVEGRYVINEREAELIREVFREYLRGRGTRAIAQWLNGEGRLTKEGNRWSDYQVAYVLSNPTYLGRLTWNRIQQGGRRRIDPSEHPGMVVAEGTHEPLVAVEVWEAAQRLRAERRLRSPAAARTTYLLTGVARCGLCDGPIHGVTQRRRKGGTGGQSYYRCARREHYGDCSLPYVQVEQAERSLIRALQPLADAGVLTDVATALATDPEADQARRRAESAEQRLRRLERLQHIYEEELLAGTLSRREWRDRTAALGAEAQALRKEAAAARAHPIVDPAVVAATLQDLPALWAHLTAAERKQILTALVAQATLFADGRVAIAPKIIKTPG